MDRKSHIATWMAQAVTAGILAQTLFFSSRDWMPRVGTSEPPEVSLSAKYVRGSDVIVQMTMRRPQ